MTMTTITTLASLAAASLAVLAVAASVRPPQDAFSRATMDVGVVVSDIDAAAEFYGKTLGLDELSGFEVGADFCRDAGLTDGRPLAVRVFAIGKGEAATKLKLMEVAGVESKRSDNTFIHSQYGLSYLTIFVSDMNATTAQLATANVKALGKGPLALGTDAAAPHLILVRDPDGNLIELIGPRL